MKFSKETLEIFKNFSQIEDSCMFAKGNIQRTLTKGQDVFARAELSEEFPHEFRHF